MGTCTYCYDETRPGEGREHPACQDEYSRRSATSQCLMCGELPMAPGSTACHDCHMMSMGGTIPQFRNYPGGV